MRVKAILIGLLVLSVPSAGALAQATSDRARTGGGRASGAKPLVLGHGVGLFKIGKVLAQDKFDNLDNWVVQVQQRSGFKPARVEARENSLDCFVPGRGCTVWFRQKLKTRVTIMYDVLCPTPKPAIKGVQPRDIDNFWRPPTQPVPHWGCSIRLGTRVRSAPTTRCTATTQAPAVVGRRGRI